MEGTRLSLISNSGMRYEGILGSIDPHQSTLTVKNVQIFGTEGRAANSAMEVPAFDQIYEYIIFRSQDIKDLTVLEAVAPATPFIDPAIVSMPSAPTETPKATRVTENAAKSVVPNLSANFVRASQEDTAAKIVSQLHSRDTAYPAEKYFNADGTVQEASNRRPARNFHDRPRRGRGGHGHGHHHSHNNQYSTWHQQPHEIKVPDEEFDIQSSNARFHKDKLAEVIIPEAEVKADVQLATSVAYDKNKSFFDALSCERKVPDHGSNKDPRALRQAEQSTNVETFGRPFLPNSVAYQHHRGRGRHSGYGSHRGSNRGHGHGNARRGEGDAYGSYQQTGKPQSSLY